MLFTRRNRVKCRCCACELAVVVSVARRNVALSTAMNVNAMCFAVSQ